MLRLLPACAFLLAIPSVLPACRTSPEAPPGRDQVLVLLKSGHHQPATAEEGKQVMAGHFANMQRLARERRLLLAGPFAAPKRDAELRGLFVIDAATVAEAESLASTDPGVVAGVFRLECHPLRTDAPLKEFLERELAREDEAARSGRKVDPGEGMRRYVVLTAEHGDVAERELADLAAAGRVPLLGRLDGQRGFAILDAVDVDSAQALLGERAARLGAHVLDPWFASQGVAEMAAPGTAR